MPQKKIARQRLVQKINSTFKFDGKTIAMIVAGHAITILVMTAMPAIRSLHPLLPFLPIVLIVTVVAFKARSVASELIPCPECQKPLGMMEMKIALASACCCLCGKSIVERDDGHDTSGASDRPDTGERHP